MAGASGHQVTELLQAWSGGDRAALEKLVPLVYRELRRLARRYVARERPGHTLQATALVHEAYLRLVGSENVRFKNRAHFFGVCAQLMRRILVDYARTRRYAKRGGGVQPLSLDEAAVVSREKCRELLALDDALNSLAAFDPRKSQVAELRFFGGMSVEETAEVLEISPRTVMREWTLARSWLLREMSQESG